MHAEVGSVAASTSPRHVCISQGIGSLHEQELIEMLGNCDLIWPKDAKNAKKPYVFAQFQTEDEKKEAIDKLNGKKVDEENTLKLSPAYSQRFTQRPPTDRRRRFVG
ncbi:Polyadenylate-binding protein (RRM superfamily) [Trachipleistophora hominis]|uniref:Polyadenylate-binding protein (RRM superfamily) n=1 Tax=Trachipleistophora hominis TaxID=72359 RepID=L7JXJ6_TRAHO|nr:Polyadenylate-binding protein (RRM superfamily) [Trachipleistophora hominis]